MRSMMMSVSTWRVLILGAVVAFAGTLTGCKKSDETNTNEQTAAEVADDLVGDEPLAAEEGTTVVEISVPEIHCESCANAISTKLAAVEAVKEKRVSIEKKIVWVRLPKDEAAGKNQVLAAIQSLGYVTAEPGDPATQPAASNPA